MKELFDVFRKEPKQFIFGLLFSFFLVLMSRRIPCLY